MTKKRIDVVAAVIFNQQQQVLISTRPKGKSYDGYWEFVGGKIETNETQLVALKREVFEELDLTIIHATPWMQKKVVYEKVVLNLFFWRIFPNDWQGEVHSKENQIWCWCAIDQLNQKKLLPANYSFVNALMIPNTLIFQTNYFTDSAEKFRIVYYLDASEKNSNIFIEFERVKQMKRLPDYYWVAVVVENQTEMHACLDANALIWNISSDKSYLQLLAVLQQGQVIPIMAMNYNQSQKNKLAELGIHGFIIKQSLVL